MLGGLLPACDMRFYCSRLLPGSVLSCEMLRPLPMVQAPGQAQPEAGFCLQRCAAVDAPTSHHLGKAPQFR
jgi:hypothetical protein